jgi:hypothetical protein
MQPKSEKPITRSELDMQIAILSAKIEKAKSDVFVACAKMLFFQGLLIIALLLLN